MKFHKRNALPSAEPDMTPMIDVTFQLIAFFMFVLSFGEGARDARVRLPQSELAKPPDAPYESPLVLQLTDDNQVLMGGEKLPLSEMPRRLLLENQYLKGAGKDPTDATVVIRADAAAQAGVVQELIYHCQQNAFRNFALRVEQKRDGAPSGGGL